MENIQQEFEKTRMRGPDHSHIQWIREGWLFGFHRLKIVDTSDTANQPMLREGCYSICNGEIYNHQQIRNRLLEKICGSDRSLEDESSVFSSHCDCEVVPVGISALGVEKLVEEIDGVFSFVCYREDTDEVCIARDRFGVRPLFWGWNSHGELLVSSEAKSIMALVDTVTPFPPGCYWKGSMKFRENGGVGTLVGTITEYYTPLYPVVVAKTNTSLKADEINLARVKAGIRDRFTLAVRKRLMSDRPVGCLLSGGLDSSLVSALVAREFKENGKGDLLTFSIGLPGSPDLDYADRVSKWIGSKHHRVELDRSVWLEAIPEVIYAIESYDVTTVRASVGNYLISKYISENTDVVVVYNGDGSDEQSGYLYLGNAPDVDSFQEELCRLLKEIHKYDVLRSDRSVSSHWGLEARTPFLDRDFVDYYMGVVPTAWKTYGRLSKKNGIFLPGESSSSESSDGRLNGGMIEKNLLRCSFNDMDLLPQEVLWRRKEAFSDGCSSVTESWHDIIKSHVKEIITPEDFKESAGRYSPRPLSLEALYYRRIYESHFGNNPLVDHYWMPRWSEGVRDPSARELADYGEKKNVEVD